MSAAILNPATTKVKAAHGTWVLLAGILLVAFNLRAAITSLGALLPEVSAGLGLTPTQAGLITTLPALAFAAFGAVTPALTRRFSTPSILIGSMVALAAGLLLRAITDSTIVFVVTSTLALGGIAIGNVLLPAVVRQLYPEKAGLITGVYTMTLIAGTAAAGAASVPIADAFGSWRAGLAAWSILAVFAALPWIGRSFSGAREKSKMRVAKSKLAWAMAVYFGLQSLGAYATMGWLAPMFRDAGFSPEVAGLLLAGVPFFGMPVALLMPTLAVRARINPKALVLLLSGAMIASYLGLALSPDKGAVIWVALLAIGQGAFPFALAMIGMRARTGRGIVALSAFSQSTGYMIAALGPLVVGLLHEMTGEWRIPLAFLLVAAVVQALVGLVIARPRFVEDEL